MNAKRYLVSVFDPFLSYQKRAQPGSLNHAPQLEPPGAIAGFFAPAFVFCETRKPEIKPRNTLKTRKENQLATRICALVRVWLVHDKPLGFLIFRVFGGYNFGFQA
jgi:hypothetical protein